MNEVMLKANATVAKFLDLGQRLFSCSSPTPCQPSPVAQ
jgi:hypothetical protein